MMTLKANTRLGPYEILEPLGAGGMGEVYRARDTRLERTVAVKILPAQFSADPVRKQRFEREAKTISSLNHPNICTLHDIGSQDGVDYLVMECVDGETLAKRLEKGPLPLEQVLKYGAQIADALDKAHRNGVVHRDLKPGNMMLTPTGAKLLDFGLAKPAMPLASLATLTGTAAKQSPATQEGTIVGTFQYMSPEQVEGKELDGRSDIFSLGAVLYEMLTGIRAFDGKSQLSVASAILEKEPKPLSTAKPMTPPALDHAIKKCLAKHADERWQSASDLASELKWITETPAGSTSIAFPRGAGKSRERLAWIISSALLVVLVAGAMWWRNSTRPEQTMYFAAPLPFPARDMALAPNGQTVAVVAYLESARKNMIWIYELGSQNANLLAGTQGASYPFWSPDGRTLAFFADGKLKKVGVSGGQVQTISDASGGRGGTWNKDGVIVFTPEAALGAGLYRVPASGGTPTPISKPDASRGEQSHRWPMFLPDGKHYLYLAANFSGQKGVNAIFVGSLDSNEKLFVVDATANASYAAPGYLLFPRGKNLFAQRFDLKRFALTGEPTTILTELQYQQLVRRAVFAVSDSGLLVAQTGGGAVALSQPVWFDRKGNEAGVVSKPDVYQNLSIAPNGKSVAVDRTDMDSQNQNSDIWTHELQRETAKRLTFDPSTHVVPVWSPDAARLVFSSNQKYNFDLYVKNSDGSQEDTSIVHDDHDKNPNDWSRSGKYILYTRGSDLWFVTYPELKSSQFLKAPGVLRNGQFSPDGKWVAHASNETGKWEIYVTSFPEPRGKWQVSTGGGEQPRWRGDGKELFYLSSDRKMMAAPVITGANFDVGTPAALFQSTPRQPVSTNDQFVYDVSRDGQRFLILTPLKQSESAPMSIVLNWTAKLNK
jgi:serine/threonine protein kinase/Tol biopolymer transport system component